MKIFVTYHKETPLIENEILTPIHAGAEQSPKKLEMIGDNTGDHISERNPNWCELTVLYWMWKNVKADYYGLFHYRRVYDLSGNGERFFYDTSAQGLKKLGLDAENIQKVCESYDLVMPRRWNVHPKFELHNRMSIYDYYAREHIEGDLKTTLKVLYELYPEYQHSAQLVMHLKKSYYFNMFIMKRSIFERFAEWLFAILFEVEKRITVNQEDAYQKRVFGFLAERLVNIFVHHEMSNNPELKIREIFDIPLGIFDGKHPYGSLASKGPTWKVASQYLIPAHQPVETPKVTLVLSLLPEAEKYLEASLNSLINQELESIEVIVVGDRSCNTVAVNEILERYAATDQRIRFTQSIGEGIKQAKGEYLFFISSRDFLERAALAVMVLEAKKQTADLVCCKTRVIDADTEKTVNSSLYYQTLLADGLFNRVISPEELQENIFQFQPSAWGKLYLRAFFQESGRVYNEEQSLESNLLFLEFITHAPKVVHLPAAYYLHRRRKGEKSIAGVAQPNDVIALLNNTEKLIKESRGNRAGWEWEQLKDKFFSYRLELLWELCNQLKGGEQEQFYQKLRKELLSYDLTDYELSKVSDAVVILYEEILNYRCRPGEKRAGGGERLEQKVPSKPIISRSDKMKRELLRPFLQLKKSLRSRAK